MERRRSESPHSQISLDIGNVNIALSRNKIEEAYERKLNVFKKALKFIAEKNTEDLSPAEMANSALNCWKTPLDPNDRKYRYDSNVFYKKNRDEIIEVEINSEDLADPYKLSFKKLQQIAYGADSEKTAKEALEMLEILEGGKKSPKQ